MSLQYNRQQIPKVALVALIFLFGLQLIRVLLSLFTYYLRDTKGVSAITLAGLVIGLGNVVGLIAAAHAPGLNRCRV